MNRISSFSTARRVRTSTATKSVAGATARKGFGLGSLAVAAGAAAVVGAVSYALAPSQEKNKFEQHEILNFTVPEFLPVAEAADGAVPHYGAPGTNKERTFIAIKPDGVNRGLIADIIGRFEKKGFKLVGLKFVKPTQAFAEEHYDDLSSRPFFPALVKYFSSGPVVAMVWEGKDVISTGRKLIGATNPASAEIGTIRGDYCIIMGRNIIHGSDSPDAAKHEISLWFKENEVADWESALHKWTYEN